MTDEPQEMGMVFAFSDPLPSFVNGFELGMIWQEIDGEGKAIVDRGFEEGFPIHEENVETLRRMCAARNYRLEANPATDGWIAVRLTFVGNKKPSLALVGR